MYPYVYKYVYMYVYPVLGLRARERERLTPEKGNMSVAECTHLACMSNISIIHILYRDNACVLYALVFVYVLCTLGGALHVQFPE